MPAHEALLAPDEPAAVIEYRAAALRRFCWSAIMPDGASRAGCTISD